MPADQVICGIPFYTRVWTEKFGQSAITSEVLGMDGAKNYAKENQMTEPGMHPLARMWQR